MATKKTRIKVYLNKNLDMSPGKKAAQAIHAALVLLGVHPGEDVPVVVLHANKGTVAAQQAVISDHGVTEVAPGSITAGASWDFPVETESLDVYMRYLWAYDTKTKADEAFVKARDEYFASIAGEVRDSGPVEPFGHKD